MQVQIVAFFGGAIVSVLDHDAFIARIVPIRQLSGENIAELKVIRSVTNSSTRGNIANIKGPHKG